MSEPPKNTAGPSAPNPQADPKADAPWVIRTYSGHSSAKRSNELFRANLARGQTGLSIAFDLPTQTGLDPDHPLSRGEVGKVGVPVAHLGDLETLLDGIPLARMNTSMTINAPAAWLLALYVALAEKQGASRAQLAGTTQNDILKEYLARGTYIFPPKPSLKLTADTIAFCAREMPKWNPVNICSYHLQEAGATPAEEVAFALANAVAVLDAVRESGKVAAHEFPALFGRISFFVNAGTRFVTEVCKLRAFARLWDELARDRYGVADAKLRRFRYGVQVNSLGLTEQQPENNVYRILLSMLGVVLSKDARARAVQLPAWNEALGLPRPWDQQWSIRMQQIVAYETDLLEFPDILHGSAVIEAKTEDIAAAARAELAVIAEMGGAVAGIESGYMKRRLVESNAKRLVEIESGARKVVGVNCFTEADPSPLGAGGEGFLKPDPAAEAEQIEKIAAWRKARDGAKVASALAALEAAAREGLNVMEPSIACARAGVTTGEWADTLRRAFGEYRAPTGIAGARAGDGEGLESARAKVRALGARLGRPPRLLVAKPGLDGHSNGAEQVALRARDAGFEVIYEGIRATPERIVRAALQEGADAVGVSVLSGSHLALVAAVIKGLRAEGAADVPVVAGGIIPPADAEALKRQGIARVFTPKDYDLSAIVAAIAGLIGDSVRSVGRPASSRYP
ncbi:MAG: protein meaA [Alphaproteobacteria bacterium]|nr:protein meaA [Alphaproteobacteria bacterium]MBM3733175.1 protein meaA [Acidimicrobiia bacterium]